MNFTINELILNDYFLGVRKRVALYNSQMFTNRMPPAVYKSKKIHFLGPGESFIKWPEQNDGQPQLHKPYSLWGFWGFSIGFECESKGYSTTELDTYLNHSYDRPTMIPSDGINPCRLYFTMANTHPTYTDWRVGQVVMGSDGIPVVIDDSLTSDRPINKFNYVKIQHTGLENWTKEITTINAHICNFRYRGIMSLQQKLGAIK